MKGQTRKVTLPGEMYERAGRWWWRVQLPGEDKAKARPLRSPGAKAAASDRGTAEKVAVEMWEQAATQHGARQITLDCAQKVERLKAQFLDKVRHLTEIVESANAKARAEAQARAELEARLNVMMQTAGQNAAAPAAPAQSPASPQPLEYAAPADVRPPMESSQPGDRVERPNLPDRTLGISEPTVEDTAKASLTVAPESSIPAEMVRSSGGAERAVHTDNAEATKDTRPAKSDAAEAVCEAYPLSVPVEMEDQTLPPQTGTCDCCEQTDIPAPDLTPIESGQLLCPDCLMALHLDISRIEAEAFTDSHA